MKQSTLSVPLDVKPGSCSRLCALLDKLKDDQDGASDKAVPNFSRVHAEIPTLHFMSMSVFNDSHYDPIFIIEANFDGDDGVFWGQLEALMGDTLREMLRCCKRPLDTKAELYDAVTCAGSAENVAPYLAKATQRPSVFFHGNRGLSRDRILDEQRLFLALRDEIDDPARRGPNPYRVNTPAHARTALRAKMLPAFPWLAERAPPRIPASERLLDIYRLMRFVVVALLVLSAAGMVLAMLMHAKLYLAVVALATVIVFALVNSDRKALKGTEVVNRVKVGGPSLERIVAAIGIVFLYVGLAVLFLCPIVLGVQLGLQALAQLLGLHTSIAPMYGSTLVSYIARFVGLGLLTLPIVLLLLLLIVRWNERRDSSQDAPKQDERMLREIVRREDWITQNHMGSIVLIKPGVFRSNIINVGHYALGLLLRVTPDARAGYLGSMRTVHFAHWAFLNNGSRLLFFSNFDHSWGSYLDDFIEKAHTGLTLAWGSGVGFPPARMLILDGASHGRQFKNWALASRTVSRFWYSAYPELSVDQIERNNRIANGLRPDKLNEKEAALWVLDL